MALVEEFEFIHGGRFGRRAPTHGMYALLLLLIYSRVSLKSAPFMIRNQSETQSLHPLTKPAAQPNLVTSRPQASQRQASSPKAFKS